MKVFSFAVIHFSILFLQYLFNGTGSQAQIFNFIVSKIQFRSIIGAFVFGNLLMLPVYFVCILSSCIFLPLMFSYPLNVHFPFKRAKKSRLLNSGSNLRGRRFRSPHSWPSFWNRERDRSITCVLVEFQFVQACARGTSLCNLDLF